MTRTRAWVTGGLLPRLSRVTSSGRFVPEIDGLRFIAIGTVVLFHVASSLDAKNPAFYATPHEGNWLAAVVRQGFRGVSLFFILSGLILGLPFAGWRLTGGSPVRLRQYFMRRLTRLEPPYILCMLLFFLLRAARHHEGIGELGKHLGASLAYSHNLIYGSHPLVNNVAWSLEIEIQFYLLLPLIALLFAIQSTFWRRLVLVSAGFTAVAAHVFVLDSDPRLALTVLNYMQFFLTGLLLADLFVVGWQGGPTRRLSWDLVSLIGWPALFVLWQTPDPFGLRSGSGDDTLLGALLFPPLAFLLYCAAFRGPVTNRILTNPWITTIGGMCYTIYLLHNPLIGVVASRTERLVPTASYSLNLLAQAALIVPVVLLVCVAYFVLVERPCMVRDWPRRAADRIRQLASFRVRLAPLGRTSVTER